MTDDVQDIADMAEAAEQRFRDAALAASRSKAQHLAPCGRCYWCDETIQAGTLFCRPDVGGSCRDDYEREQAARRRNGD